MRLKAALLFRPGVVVANVPYHLRRYASEIDGSGQTGKGSRRRKSSGAQAHARAKRVVRPGWRPNGHQ
jgi:hypothetical protein